jgi:AraC-like DNA-binding protein
VRYSTIVNEGILLRTREGPQFTITLQYVGVERHLDRHQIEFWLASVVHICRHLTARRLLPCSMQVVHHRNAGSSELEAFLGRAIKFGAAADEIEFSDNLADMPVVRADPYLNELLVTYCEEHLAQTAPGARPLRVEIENAIAPLLPHGQAHLEELARRLGMSRRTLTRRLSSEGLTFARILNDMRADLARRYLRNEHLGISQIAWLLGYQEVSAFTHAFKRWTGSTPSKARGRG